MRPESDFEEFCLYLFGFFLFCVVGIIVSEWWLM